MKPFKQFILEYRTKGALGKKTIEKLKKTEEEQKPVEEPKPSEEQNSTDIKIEYSVPFIEKWYKVFNDKYFNGELKMPPLAWRKVKSFMGRCSNVFNIFTQKISCKSITLNKELKDFKNFRNTLVHEMIHQWQHETITEEEIKRANSACRWGANIEWWNYLGLAQEGGHTGKWLEKAQELNKMFPELKITRYHNAETLNNTDEEGNISQNYIAEVSNGHLLTYTVRWSNKNYCTFLSDKAYNELVETLKNPEKYQGFIFKEYKFKPEKLANYGVKPAESITVGYKWQFFVHLCKEGAVDKYDYEILKRN